MQFTNLFITLLGLFAVSDALPLQNAEPVTSADVVPVIASSNTSGSLNTRPIVAQAVKRKDIDEMSIGRSLKKAGKWGLGGAGFSLGLHGVGHAVLSSQLDHRVKDDPSLEYLAGMTKATSLLAMPLSALYGAAYGAAGSVAYDGAKYTYRKIKQNAVRDAQVEATKQN